MVEGDSYKFERGKEAVMFQMVSRCNGMHSQRWKVEMSTRIENLHIECELSEALMNRIQTG